MSTQQLIKKSRDADLYSKIYPLTFTDLVVDRKSGDRLDNILAKNNSIFLLYTGSKESTRLTVPIELRRRGLGVTYVLYDKTIITEYYKSDNIDNTSWGDSINWSPVSTWKSYRGYSNERPILELQDDGYPFYDRGLKKYICWNGTEWVNFDGTPLI